MTGKRRPIDLYIYLTLLLLGLRLVLEITLVATNLEHIFVPIDLALRIVVSTVVVQFSLWLSLGFWAYVIGVLLLIPALPVWPGVVLPLGIYLWRYRDNA